MKAGTDDIVRFGLGPDDIMIIENVVYRHISDGHDHYYGIDKFGKRVSASSRNCSEATSDEQRAYIQQRRHPY